MTEIAYRTVNDVQIPNLRPARDGANRQVRKDAPALYQGAPAGAVETGSC